jgi:hypothetical protein
MQQAWLGMPLLKASSFAMVTWGQGQVSGLDLDEAGLHIMLLVNCFANAPDGDRQQVNSIPTENSLQTADSACQ